MRQIPLTIGAKELRRAVAMESLQESWHCAEKRDFDQVSDDEVDEEIHKVRQGRTCTAEKLIPCGVRGDVG